MNTNTLSAEHTTEHLLEELVDKHGLAYVLERLGAVCWMKAAHLNETWQDATPARTWTRAGQKIDRVATSEGLPS